MFEYRVRLLCPEALGRLEADQRGKARFRFEFWGTWLLGAVNKGYFEILDSFFIV